MSSLEFVIDGDVAVKVTVTEVDGSLEFNVHVIQPGEEGYTGQIGEVNGLFFDLVSDVGDMVFTATDADGNTLSMDADEASVSNLGGGINMNGSAIEDSGAFDIGVLLDKTGLGKGDVQDITFTLDADVDLSLSDVALQDFGVRLTSVGEPDGSRDGSLKLVTQAPDVTPEEPVVTNTANDDTFFVFEDVEFDGLAEVFEGGATSILSNDTTDTDGTVGAYGGQVTEVQGTAVEDQAIIVSGSNGGLLMVYPDGTVDFSANGEFDALGDLDVANTTFTYAVEGGDTATVNVTVFGLDDGGGEFDDGFEEPVDDGFLF